MPGYTRAMRPRDEKSAASPEGGENGGAGHVDPPAARPKRRARRPTGRKRAKRQGRTKPDGDTRARPRPKREKRSQERERASDGPAATKRARDAFDAKNAFYEEVSDYAPYLGIATDQGSFVVATSDRHIGRSLFVKGARPEFAVLRRAVAAITALTGEDAITDRLFVDVGANIGTSTIPALVSHGFGAAVCCEPDEENYRLLRTNVALNGLDERVTCLPVGVSDQVGRASLVTYEGSGGNSWVAVDSDRVQDWEARRAARRASKNRDPEPREMTLVEVELVTLDGLAENGIIDPDRVGLVWIDAEGHEGHVIAGAGTLVDRGLPIVVEFHPEGLDHHGDRDRIHKVAERCYTHFLDVRRRDRDRTQPHFTLRPIDDLAAYADRLLDPATPGYFTDLLLLRLEGDQANAPPNLSELMQPSADRSE
jgi:FkbM family methyltransferase